MTNTLDPADAGGTAESDVLDQRRRVLRRARTDTRHDSPARGQALREIDEDGWDALQTVGRALHVARPSLDSTLTAVVTTAAEFIPNAHHAGVNLYVRGKFLPQVVSGDAPHQLDVVQQQLDDGPCIAASRDQVVVRIDKMSDDDRWPQFAEAAVALDVHSMLCVPLWLDDQRLGSMSLYSSLTDAFDRYALHVATLLGTHAAIAIADARRSENLQRALVTRDVIGQAKGILMERHRITSDQAFAMLTKASQNTNRKLSEVAETVASTGAVPHPH